MNNIHATLVSLNNKGVLLLGASGSGKSDVALRLIEEKGAILVADDRVDLRNLDGKIIGSAPKQIKGKLEIRNIGIVDFNTIDETEILLCVELVKDKDVLERLPQDEFEVILGKKITKIKLYPFECSTINKIVIKISSIIN